PAYFGPSGANKSISRISRPCNQGASSRRTVSTSGSSGIRDPPLVQRAADDGALQPEALVEVKICVRRHAATGNEATCEGVTQARDRFFIDAEHGAVAPDIRVDDLRNALFGH